MAIVDAEGLVLRSLRYRETSRILTILTPGCGKLHLIAKGARDTKSPFSGALEPLTRSWFVFYLKKNRDLHLLRAASPIAAYLHLLANPAIYHLGCAALEFVDRVLTDQDPSPEIYAALTTYLDDCDARATTAGPAQTCGACYAALATGLKAFQMRIVVLAGYAPELSNCAGCGGDVRSPGGFGVAEGGLLCRRCAAAAECLPVSEQGASLLRSLVGGEAGDACAGKRSVAAVPELPPATGREVTAIIEAFLRFHVTGYRGLRSLRSFEEWLRMPREVR